MLKLVFLQLTALPLGGGMAGGPLLCPGEGGGCRLAGPRGGILGLLWSSWATVNSRLKHTVTDVDMWISA